MCVPFFVKDSDSESYEKVPFYFYSAFRFCRSGSLRRTDRHGGGLQCEDAALVVVPDGGVGRRMPVLYLLHGFGGSYTTWQNITDLRPLADACVACGQCKPWCEYHLDIPAMMAKVVEDFG